MSDQPPEGMTDEQLDALDAEITHDIGVLRAMDDQLLAKVRRYRAELARRQRPDGDVIELPRREPGDSDFRPRPSNGPKPTDQGSQ